MAEIFLSYARDDEPIARQFADAFGAAGFDVWWDATLRSGEIFDEAIEEALDAAKAVVVLWSPNSVKSRWVRAEAAGAQRKGTLFPVMIADCRKPLAFELHHTPDLSAWDGDPGHRHFQSLAENIRKSISPARPGSTGKVTTPTKLSIVVLPFANMSRDEEQEYFADGVSEDIITDLSKVSSLMVIARNTAFMFKGKHVDVCDVARQLGVSHVLEGSVRRAANRIRVTAQLIDGATGGHVWAERYDRDIADIFDLQDDLTQEIVGALKLRLLPGEKEAIEKRETSSAEAYDHYLRARALRAAMEIVDQPKAVQAYRKALELDPLFAKAWAGLATLLLNLRTIFSQADKYSAEEMEAAFRRARELAPDHPDIVSAMVQRCQYERDWAGSETWLAAARRNNDVSFSAYSNSLCAMGQVSKAIEWQRKVVAADPLSGGAEFMLQSQLDCLRRFEEAEAEYEKSSALPMARYPIEFRAVKRAFAMGDRKLAESRYAARFLAHGEHQPFARALVAVFDHPEAAIGVLRSAFEDPALDPIRADAIAFWATFFGDDELAWDAFKRAHLPKEANFLAGVWQPHYGKLRRKPEFKQFLIDSGLAGHWRSTGNWGDFARPLGNDDFEVIA